LYAPDVPDKMEDTLAFWEQIKEGMYDVYTSYLMFEEIGRCSEQKLTLLAGYLNQIEHTRLNILTKEAVFLSDELIKLGILTERHRFDCNHIALAVAHECDMIVSWNFRHINNIKTINGVRAISLLHGYPAVNIYSPTVLLKRSE